MADWDWLAAEAHYRRALDLNPNSAVAHDGLRYYLVVAGRYDEALSMLRRWHDLDPAAPNYPALLGWHYLSARRYDLVVDELDRESSKHSMSSSFGRLWRTVAYAMSARSREAREACEAVLSAGNVAPRAMSVCGFVFGRMGDHARAVGILNALRERSQKGEYTDPFLLATVEAGLGNGDRVLAHLRRAADEHSSQIIALTTAPWFDPFHDDPRYHELVHRIGFPQFHAG